MGEGLDVPFLIDTFFLTLSGVPITLTVAFVALLIAFPLGILLAYFRFKQIPILNSIVRVYVSFVRGTPIIIQIFVIYNSIPLLLNVLFTKYNVNIDVFEINPIWYAFIVFSFSTTAILIEIFRSAISTIDKGQLEAAYSVGLTNLQAYRRIAFPQILVVALPNLCTATVNLIKATSLGYAMSLQEITLIAKMEANIGYNYIEAYIDVFIVYLILCSLIEFAFKLYEKRLAKYKPSYI